jgi:hypothetical protein
LSAVLDAIREGLASMTGSQAPAAGSSGGAGGEASAADLAVLARLQQRLDDGDSESIDLLDDHAAAVQRALGSEADALGRLIRGFDFVAAAAALRAACSARGITLPAGGADDRTS